MSPVAETVIPVPEVIEHFGDAQKILARLVLTPVELGRAYDRRIKLCNLSVSCYRALALIDVTIDFKPGFSRPVLDRGLRRALGLIDAVISGDLSGARHPSGYMDAFRAATTTLSLVERAI